MQFVYTNKIARTFLVPEVKIALKIFKKKLYDWIEDISFDLKKNKTSFSRLRTKNGSAMVFRSNKLGLILKINGTFSAPGTIHFRPTPKKAIPTLMTQVKQGYIRIQPIAIQNIKMIKNAKKNSKNLSKDFGVDYKDENLGVWNNRVVSLDW